MFSKKVPVSPRALIARLNRHLRHKGLQVRKWRGHRARWGEYYLLDYHQNLLHQENLSASDLEGIAREERVLAPWEKVEYESTENAGEDKAVEQAR